MGEEGEAVRLRAAAERTLRAFNQTWSDAMEGAPQADSLDLWRRIEPVLRGFLAQAHVDATAKAQELVARAASLRARGSLDAARRVYALAIGIPHLAAEPLLARARTGLYVTEALRALSPETRPATSAADANHVVECLRQARRAADPFFRDEESASLLYDLTHELADVARSLLRAGFALQAAETLEWCIVALESVAILCSVRYLSWRVRLYVLLAQSLGPVRQFARARAVVRAGLERVAKLEALEATDPPVPPEHVATILCAFAALRAVLAALDWAEAQRSETELASSARSQFPDSVTAQLEFLRYCASFDVRTALDATVLVLSNSATGAPLAATGTESSNLLTTCNSAAAEWLLYRACEERHWAAAKLLRSVTSQCGEKRLQLALVAMALVDLEAAPDDSRPACAQVLAGALEASLKAKEPEGAALVEVAALSLRTFWEASAERSIVSRLSAQALSVRCLAQLAAFDALKLCTLASELCRLSAPLIRHCTAPAEARAGGSGALSTDAQVLRALENLADTLDACISAVENCRQCETSASISSNSQQSLDVRRATIACLLTDLTSASYRVRLSIGLAGARKAAEREAERETKRLTDLARLSGTVSSRGDTRPPRAASVKQPFASPEEEARLLTACSKNHFQRALLFLEMADLRPHPTLQAPLVHAAVEELEAARRVEAKLKGPLADKSITSARGTLAAPTLIGRTPHSVLLRLSVPRALIQTHRPRGIVILGQPVLSAETVPQTLGFSATRVPGTGVEIDLEAHETTDAFINQNVAIDGLAANELYVFAFVLVDGAGKPLEALVSPATCEIATLVPMPLSYLWSLLALRAQQLELRYASNTLLSDAERRLFEKEHGRFRLVSRRAVALVAEMFTRECASTESSAPTVWRDRLSFMRLDSETLCSAPPPLLLALARVLSVAAGLNGDDSDADSCHLALPGQAQGALLPRRVAEVRILQAARWVLLALQASVALSPANFMVTYCAEQLLELLAPLISGDDGHSVGEVLVEFLLVASQVLINAKTRSTWQEWTAGLSRITARWVHATVTVLTELSQAPAAQHIADQYVSALAQIEGSPSTSVQDLFTLEDLALEDALLASSDAALRSIGQKALRSRLQARARHEAAKQGSTSDSNPGDAATLKAGSGKKAQETAKAASKSRGQDDKKGQTRDAVHDSLALFPECCLLLDSPELGLARFKEAAFNLHTPGAAKVLLALCEQCARTPERNNEALLEFIAANALQTDAGVENRRWIAALQLLRARLLVEGGTASEARSESSIREAQPQSKSDAKSSKVAKAKDSDKPENQALSGGSSPDKAATACESKPGSSFSPGGHCPEWLSVQYLDPKSVKQTLDSAAAFVAQSTAPAMERPPELAPSRLQLAMSSCAQAAVIASEADCSLLLQDALAFVASTLALNQISPAQAGLMFSEQLSSLIATAVAWLGRRRRRAGLPQLPGSNNPAFVVEERCLNSLVLDACAVQTGAFWFLEHTDIDTFRLTRFVCFALQSLLHGKSWKAAVEHGCAYNELTCSLFGNEIMPIVVYAQQRLVEASEAEREKRVKELTALEADAERECAAILKRKSTRRSQRGKQEEDAKLADVQQRLEAARASHAPGIAESTADAQRDKALLAQLAAAMSSAVASPAGAMVPLRQARLVAWRAATETAGTTVGNGCGSPSFADAARAYRGAIERYLGKRQLALASLALLELGDVSMLANERQAAGDAWRQGIDAALDEFNALQNVERLVAEHAGSSLLEKLGLVRTLVLIATTWKLAEFASDRKRDQRRAAVRLGVEACASLFTCSVAHPRCDEPWRFAEYVCSDLWPGVSESVLSNPELCKAGHLLGASEFFSLEAMTDSADRNGAVRALPALVLMHYVASRVCDNKVAARRALLLRALALAESGFLGAASEWLMRIGLPVSGRYEETLSPTASQNQSVLSSVASAALAEGATPADRRVCAAFLLRAGLCTDMRVYRVQPTAAAARQGGQQGGASAQEAPCNPQMSSSRRLKRVVLECAERLLDGTRFALEKARIAEARGEEERALQLARECMASLGDDGEARGVSASKQDQWLDARLLVARLLVSQERVAEALAELRCVMDESNALGDSVRAQEAELLQTIAVARKGDSSPALALLSKQAAGNPKDYRPWWLWAKLLRLLGSDLQSRLRASSTAWDLVQTEARLYGVDISSLPAAGAIKSEMPDEASVTFEVPPMPAPAATAAAAPGKAKGAEAKAEKKRPIAAASAAPDSTSVGSPLARREVGERSRYLPCVGALLDAGHEAAQTLVDSGRAADALAILSAIEKADAALSAYPSPMLDAEVSRLRFEAEESSSDKALEHLDKCLDILSWFQHDRATMARLLNKGYSFAREDSRRWRYAALAATVASCWRKLLDNANELGANGGESGGLSGGTGGKAKSSKKGGSEESPVLPAWPLELLSRGTKTSPIPTPRAAALLYLALLKRRESPASFAQRSLSESDGQASGIDAIAALHNFLESSVSGFRDTFCVQAQSEKGGMGCIVSLEKGSVVLFSASAASCRLLGLRDAHSAAKLKDRVQRLRHELRRANSETGKSATESTSGKAPALTKGGGKKHDSGGEEKGKRHESKGEISDRSAELESRFRDVWNEFCIILGIERSRSVPPTCSLDVVQNMADAFDGGVFAVPSGGPFETLLADAQHESH